jgi:hypothetical protein
VAESSPELELFQAVNIVHMLISFRPMLKSLLTLHLSHSADNPTNRNLHSFIYALLIYMLNKYQLYVVNAFAYYFVIARRGSMNRLNILNNSANIIHMYRTKENRIFSTQPTCVNFTIHNYAYEHLVLFYLSLNFRIFSNTFNLTKLIFNAGYQKPNFSSFNGDRR